MSETAAARKELAPYCKGVGLDIGFGGAAITPSALTMDLPKPYCPSLEGHRQILQGDARWLDFICDDALDYIYSSHLLEDFLWRDLPEIVEHWRTKLRPGGLLITLCPDEQKYKRHCKDTGQTYNKNHKNHDFSCENFYRRVLVNAKWKLVKKEPSHGAYSWYIVAEKI